MIKPYRFLLLLSALAISASGLPSQPLANDFSTGEGTLSIIAWPGMMERGETDKNYDWVTPFEKSTNCKVTVISAASSDEMVSLMRHGGYDLVTASGDAAQRLITEGLVRSLNLTSIVNWNNLDPRLQEAPWHTVNGVHYGIPFQWAPHLLAYNSKIFAEPPTSWSIVFVEQNLPDGKSNKGRLQALDDPMLIADAAVFLMKAQPQLGIKNPYELNPIQFSAAIDLLKSQHHLLNDYWRDPMKQIEDLTQERVVATSIWPFQLNFLSLDDAAIAATLPSEGATGWADTLMMHVAAAHPNCAYMWLNYSLEEKPQGDIAAWLGSVPAVPGACHGNNLLTESGCTTNGADYFDRIWFWQLPQLQCKTQGYCVPYRQWVSEFASLKAKNSEK